MKANLPKKLKSTLLASSLCLAVFLFPLKSEALTVEEVPNPRQVYDGWVTDLAEILTDSTEAQLNQTLEQLEAKNGTEMAVVTVPETAPAASPKEFTTELFNYWGIGKKEQDNGVLFLISVGDRRVEIETGYGVEGILPDAQVGRIIDTKITPRFKQGDFDGGTLAGTKALVVALEGDRGLPISEKIPQNLPLPWILLTGGTILALVIGTAVDMSRRVFIKPSGKSRFRGGKRIFFCANCHQQMQRLNNTKILVSVLSEPQKVARMIGSISFEGWRCPTCSQQLAEEDFHLVAYVSSETRFRRCHTCDELTVTHTQKTLKRATQFNEGKRLIIDECHCCNYRQEKEEIIPRLPPPSSDSWIVSGGSSSRGSFGGGGGSFGGGSSGGGGAGGDW
ncbi:MAG: YgcG family protein [Xenococcaceae cyanobacterium]